MRRQPSRPHHNPASAGKEPPAPGHAYVFGASCQGLAAWGEALGFGVMLLAITQEQPEEVMRRLDAAEHGSGGNVFDDIQPDVLPWRGWAVVPMTASLLTTSGAAETAAGALRVPLPPGVDALRLSRRFAAAMTPLDAARAALLPAAVQARTERGAMPPPIPRFTRLASSWATAAGLYRWHDHQDAAHASRALAAALRSLPAAEDPLDLAVGSEAVFLLRPPAA